MIQSHSALLRHAQDFFRSDLVGLYSWDQVRIANAELRPALAPNLSYKDRRREQEQREGKGKYLEQERLIFGPWEILIYSSSEKPPVGELQLRDDIIGHEAFIVGPLDAATWKAIGEYIRATSRRRFVG